MLTSDRITPRPAEKPPLTEASLPSRIEDIGARLAELRRQYHALEKAKWAIGRLPEDTERRSEYDHASYLQSAMDDNDREKQILEKALSLGRPASVRDALIMLVPCIYRLDLWRGGAEDDGDSALVEKTLNQVVQVLEKLAGVTVEDLGFEEYFLRSPAPDKLIENAEAWANSFKVASATS